MRVIPLIDVCPGLLLVGNLAFPYPAVCGPRSVAQCPRTSLSLGRGG